MLNFSFESIKYEGGKDNNIRVDHLRNYPSKSVKNRSFVKLSEVHFRLVSSHHIENALHAFNCSLTGTIEIIDYQRKCDRLPGF